MTRDRTRSVHAANDLGRCQYRASVGPCGMRYANACSRAGDCPARAPPTVPPRTATPVPTATVPPATAAAATEADIVVSSGRISTINSRHPHLTQ